MGKLSIPTNELAPYPTHELIRDLLHYLRPYGGHFIAASVIRLTGDLLVLVIPIATADIITILSRSPIDQPSLLRSFGYLLAASVGRVICLGVAKVIAYRVSERAALDAQRATLIHLERLDAVWHEHENSGNKLKRIERGGESLDKLLRLWVDSYIEIGVSFVGIVIILSRLDPTIGLLFVGFASSYYWLSRTLTQPAARAARIVNVREEVLIGAMFELINNIRTVKVLGMRTGFFQHVDAAIRELYRSVVQRIYRFQTRNSIQGIWTEIARIAILGFAAWAIVHGRSDVGFFALVWGYFNRIHESTRELSDNAQQVMIARDALGRMQAILAEPVHIDDETEKVAMPTDWRMISLKSVSFSYGAQRVLKDISLTIRRGEKIGIVGISGAGKSTLFKLLLKEHEGFTGQILVDDVPLEQITRSSYFDHTAVVLQDTEVFNFSLRDNVVLASADHAHDGKRLAEALEVAHVTDFLSKLPQGLDTLIGEKGFRLSGGERQRLGIARAIFKRPELLFLDEATSHLDSESEAKIQDSLGQFFTNVTAIVIAHRLSTIKQMDRILVLEQGRILEEGSFAQLQKKKGRFHDLWEQQKL